jgi:hypothetical protein
MASTVIGMGGYAYAYDDKKGSVACVDPSAFCGAGATATMDAMGTVWGGGIGVNLNQIMATSSTSPPINTFAATGSGITYALSSFPTQGMRIIIDSSAMDYCAPITGASGTVKWSSFNTKCWDNSGMTLAGAPTATHINFQVNSASAAADFDFCVTAVSFAP